MLNHIFYALCNLVVLYVCIMAELAAIFVDNWNSLYGATVCVSSKFHCPQKLLHSLHWGGSGGQKNMSVPRHSFHMGKKERLNVHNLNMYTIALMTWIQALFCFEQSLSVFLLEFCKFQIGSQIVLQVSYCDFKRFYYDCAVYTMKIILPFILPVGLNRNGCLEFD